MLKRVQQIDIVFENCEVAKVPIGDIHNWGVENIKKSISNCNQYESYEIYYAKEVFILFKNLKDLTYYNNFQDKEVKLIDRLRLNDVTHIDIMYENGTNDYISVPWGSKSQFKNAFQEIKKIKFKYDREPIFELFFQNKWTFYKIFKYFFYILKVYRYKINKFLNKEYAYK